MTGSKTMTQASENGSSEAVEWELRPGGMLVQKREDETSSTVPLVKIKVFHDSYQHEVTVPAQSTFDSVIKQRRRRTVPQVVPAALSHPQSDIAAMTHAMTLMAQTMQEHFCTSTVNVQTHATPYLGKLLKFKKMHPPSFKGKMDYQLLHDWIIELEKIFSMFKYSEYEKVCLGAYQLTDTAYIWWQRQEHARNDENLTWEGFKALLLAKFAPEAEHERLLMDFVNLRQGDMTVEEFEQKFTRLAQFVPYLIDTPTKHKNWFIRALRDELQDLVRVTNASTFEEVVKAALHLEAATKKRATRTSQPKIEKITSRPDKGRKKVSLAVIQEKSKNDVRTCFNCQKRGHVAKDCRVKKCYKCKKVGHVARFCKKLEQTQPLTTLPLHLVVNKGRDLVNFQGRVYALTEVEATVSDIITWELKKVLAQETDLTPDEQRLLFRGKEKEDDERLHMAGVKDMSRVVLLQDPASRERKLEQVKRVQETSKASGAVASVRDEVDKLVEKVYALESYMHRDSKVNDQEFVVLTELLMRLLLKLDGIEADGEAKVQRRAEVRRIQHHVDMLDALKFKNSTQFRIGNNATATTEWHTFGTDAGNLNAQTGKPTSEVTNNWEKFE